MATVERISVGSDGTQANGDSYAPTASSISAGGRYVAFTSSASNLVAGDTNGAVDIFVRDRVTGLTERVSVATNGAQGEAGSVSGNVSISADGRFVAFESTATTLAPGDTNGAADVFVHDRATGTTVRISPSASSFGGSTDPSISADGRYVAYDYNPFTPGEPRRTDINIYDRESGSTQVISQGPSALLSAPSISADGRFVSYESRSTYSGGEGILLNDRASGTPPETVATQSFAPSVSADGRFVAFQGSASFILPGDTNGTDDIFVRDRATGTVERVSLSSAGAESDGGSASASISADGRLVAFMSFADNLVPGDTNNSADIFVHDRATGSTRRVSVAADGSQGNDSSYSPSISPDGHFLTYYSFSNNLVPGDTNGRPDVFVVELLENQILKGDERDDYFVGGAGDDILVGGLGNDQAFGGDGNDFVAGQDGNDIVKGEAGDDYVDGGAGNDIVVGGTGDDRAFGGDGNDFVAGQDGADIVKGDAGDDYVDGGSGADTVTGGTGDDTVLGGDGNDFVAGEDGKDTVLGGDGNDIVKGDAGDDFVDGGRGDDIVTGGIGDDSVHGGDGNDFVAGEDGRDIVKGDAGNDLVDGGAGDDTVTGGIGDDRVYGGDGNDFVAGEDGNDIVKGDAGDDFVDGGTGDDIVTGGSGNDTVVGGDGNDFVAGEDGNDLVKGDAGNDALVGGAGDDYLVGGSGDDSFVFELGFGKDTIADFEADASHDVIAFDHNLFGDFSSVAAHSQQVGSDVVITYDANNSVTLANVALSALNADDFHFF